MLDDFYTLNQIEPQGEGKYICRITLNPAHPIFAGHFPGNPITPGVCILQIIKELTEKITQKKLFLSKTSQVKFMTLINPHTAGELSLQLELNEQPEVIVVKNVTSFGDTIALKLTNTYKLC